jgi:hypothetical protein
MTRHDSRDPTALDRARDLETDPDSHPVAARGYGDRIVIAQDDRLIGLSRHDAKVLLRDLARLLTEEGQ